MKLEFIWLLVWLLILQGNFAFLPRFLSNSYSFTFSFHYSLLLAYGLAELEEEAGELTNCHTIYDNLIQHFSSTIATLEENVEKATAAALEAYDEELNVDVSNSEDAESRQKIVEDKDALKVSIKEKSEGEISSAKGAAANVWITQMRFARRAEVRISFLPFRLQIVVNGQLSYDRELNKLEVFSPNLENHLI